MIKRVHFDEVDSTEEICTVFNKLIDAHNENEEYNKEVEEYNKALGDEPDEKGEE